MLKRIPLPPPPNPHPHIHRPKLLLICIGWVVDYASSCGYLIKLRFSPQVVKISQDAEMISQVKADASPE